MWCIGGWCLNLLWMTNYQTNKPHKHTHTKTNIFRSVIKSLTTHKHGTSQLYKHQGKFNKLSRTNYSLAGKNKIQFNSVKILKTANIIHVFLGEAGLYTHTHTLFTYSYHSPCVCLPYYCDHSVIFKLCCLGFQCPVPISLERTLPKVNTVREFSYTSFIYFFMLPPAHSQHRHQSSCHFYCCCCCCCLKIVMLILRCCSLRHALPPSLLPSLLSCLLFPACLLPCLLLPFSLPACLTPCLFSSSIHLFPFPCLCLSFPVSSVLSCLLFPSLPTCFPPACLPSSFPVSLPVLPFLVVSSPPSLYLLPCFILYSLPFLVRFLDFFLSHFFPDTH